MRKTGYLVLFVAVLTMPAFFAGCGSSSPPPTNTEAGHSEDDGHDHGDQEGQDHEGHDHDNIRSSEQDSYGPQEEYQ